MSDSLWIAFQNIENQQSNDSSISFALNLFLNILQV